MAGQRSSDVQPHPAVHRWVDVGVVVRIKIINAVDTHKLSAASPTIDLLSVLQGVAV